MASLLDMELHLPALKARLSSWQGTLTCIKGTSVIMASLLDMELELAPSSRFFNKTCRRKPLIIK